MRYIFYLKVNTAFCLPPHSFSNILLHDFLCRDPLIRADLQELGDQVLCWPGDGVEELRIELVVCRGDLGPEVEAALPVLAERWSAGQEDVEDHTEGPAVNLQGVGAVLQARAGHHLWGDVLRGPTERLEDRAKVHKLAEPHVRDLHDGVGIVHRAEKDILRLQVSMANILRMEVFYGRRDLIKVQLCLNFV